MRCVVPHMGLKTDYMYFFHLQKKLSRYKFTKKLPHDTNYKNKVCVFTDEENLRDLALENGAFVAGGRDIVMEVRK